MEHLASFSLLEGQVNEVSTQALLQESEELFANGVSLIGHNGYTLGSKQLLAVLGNWHRTDATWVSCTPKDSCHQANNWLQSIDLGNDRDEGVLDVHLIALTGHHRVSF